MFKNYLKIGFMTVAILFVPILFSWPLPPLASTLAPLVAPPPIALMVAWITKMRGWAQNDVVAFLPYLVFAAIAFLSYQMNLRKILYGCALAIFGIWMATKGAPSYSMSIFLVVAPISITTVMFLKQARLTGRDGAWLLCATVLPWGFLWCLYKLFPQVSAPLYTVQFIKAWHFNHIPQLGLFLWACTLITPFIHSDRYLRRVHWAFALGFAPLFFVAENKSQSTMDLSVVFMIYGLYIFAGTLSVYLQKIYLDELTGVPNRRALNEALGRLSGNYTVAMIDIDHFKKFNDTYGHDHGDNVLKMVGQHVFSESGGKAYRYGGEEFTLLYQDQLPENIFEKVDGIRKSLAERSFHLRDKPQRGPISFVKKYFQKQTEKKGVKVTISIGIAGNPGSAKSIDDIFKAADECLYSAKENGRNCVVVYGQHTQKKNKAG